jgi:hypothetical protein
MRPLSIVLAVALSFLIAVDLRNTFNTGIARDVWGNVSSAISREDTGATSIRAAFS